jgi:hypothetical protein
MLAPLLAMLPAVLSAAGPSPALPAPSAVVIPAQARPGDAFLVIVRGLETPPSATVSGRALSFFQVPGGGFAALAALKVETPPGPLTVPIRWNSNETGADGGSPGGELQVSLQIMPPDFLHKAFDVQKQFVKPPGPALQRRIAADRAAIGRAFSQPPSPPLFAGRFALPRQDRMTAHYGDERVLNGVKASQHYGLDLAGAIGAPVAASNAGQVVLVRNCWASGRTIVLWHGAGVYSTYLHLSRTLVKVGDHVSQGQQLGMVGKSGRASGPHLHFGIKVNELYVDPESVLRMDLDFLKP